MQKITVKQIKGKPSPPDSKRQYTLVIVEDEAGSEFTSFDTALLEYGPGTVLEIEPEVVNKGGKTKVNIKDFNVISATSPAPATPAPTGNGNGYGRNSPEMYAMEEEGRRYRQQVDRVSIERQTAFNGAIELLKTSITLNENSFTTEENEFIKEAIAWGRKAIAATCGAVAPIQPVKEPEADKKTSGAGKKGNTAGTGGDKVPEFKTGAELVNYALKQGMKIGDIKTTLSINSPNEITDVAGAAAILYPEK